MSTRTRRLALPLVGALALLAGSCSSGGGSVDVTLQEFAIVPAQSDVGAGSVEFIVANEGPNDPHELVVFKTDLAPDSLPTAEDGSVVEDGEGVELIGEIEEFAVGDTETATFDLEAGNYVFICNLVEEEEGGLESHYQEGMRVAFMVT